MSEILKQAKNQTYIFAATIFCVAMIGLYPIVHICEGACSDAQIFKFIALYFAVVFGAIIAGMWILINKWKKSGFVCSCCGKPPYNPLQPPENINRCAGCGSNVH